MATELVERPLTPIEIKQRQVDHLRLLTEIDNYQSEIDEHRRCAKDAANEVARIQSRERELRRELRSGTCWETVHVEPRQKSLEFADTLVERPTDPGISATSDEPDDMETEDECSARTVREEMAEHDKPELTAIELPSYYDRFAELYPMATSHGALRDALHSVLTDEQYARLPNGTVEAWHPSSIVFQEIAHWARVELAHANSMGRAEMVPGLTLPVQLKMSAALEKAISEPKKAKGARPLSNPPKKRRSGSTPAP